MKIQRKIKVGVLFGGRSAEHEVSLVSGASVMRALNKKKYEVVPIGITKEGRWIFGSKALTVLKDGKESPDRYQPLSADPTDRLHKLDVIFPVLHGTFGEDGAIQGLLELSGLPYVGCGVLGSSMGMDKISQKKIFLTAGIPTPKFIYTTAAEYKAQSRRILERVYHDLGFPCFVKPSNLGSSVGISKVKSTKQLRSAVVLAFKYDRRVIIEQAVADPLEIECAILGNDSPKASVVGQIISNNEFYDYDAKYVDGRSKAKIPASIPKNVADKVRAFALMAFKALDLAGMSRVDFLVTRRGNIYINEVNTIPGFTSISMFPKLWAASGLKYSNLLDKLISLAIERSAVKKRLNTSYRPKQNWYS